MPIPTSAQPCGCDVTADHFCDQHRFDCPQSSNIEDASYNVVTHEMRIHFKRKNAAPILYTFQRVALTHWVDFCEAESKGSFFQTVLMPTYTGVKCS
jgi:hypothetical protein